MPPNDDRKERRGARAEVAGALWSIGPPLSIALRDEEDLDRLRMSETQRMGSIDSHGALLTLLCLPFPREP